MLGKDVIDAAVADTDIAQVIGEHVTLKRSGGSLTGPCPFHDEQTAGGFHVFPESGRWKCFSCNESGDVIDFLRKLRGIGFIDAVKSLPGYVPDPELDARPISRKPPARSYPDPDEVRATWESCTPVTTDAQVVSWLEAGAFDAAAVEDLDVCRVLGEEMPAWCRFGGADWRSLGHRLLFPCFDHRGCLASLRARRIHSGDSPKCLPPAAMWQQ